MAQGTLTADGSVQVTVNGLTHIHLSGDFGGGSVQVGFLDETGVDTPLADELFTAAVDRIFEFIGPRVATLTLSGATSPNIKYFVASSR